MALAHLRAFQCPTGKKLMQQTFDMLLREGGKSGGVLAQDATTQRRRRLRKTVRVSILKAIRAAMSTTSLVHGSFKIDKAHADGGLAVTIPVSVEESVWDTATSNAVNECVFAALDDLARPARGFIESRGGEDPGESSSADASLAVWLWTPASSPRASWRTKRGRR
jgi:hypothetical protein